SGEQSGDFGVARAVARTAEFHLQPATCDFWWRQDADRGELRYAQRSTLAQPELDSNPRPRDTTRFARNRCNVSDGKPVPYPERQLRAGLQQRSDLKSDSKQQFSGSIPVVQLRGFGSDN